MSAEPTVSKPRATTLGIGSVLLALCCLQGCEQTMKNMYHQDRYAPLAASTLWKDGRSARPLVPGTVPCAAGVAAETSSGRRGERPLQQGGPDAGNPSTLQRGQERYAIFCVPCHGASGEGNGYIVQRGFPAPPSYHIERLRSAADAYLYEVISNGHGVMYGYGDRLDEQDRWAVIAYLRALQRSNPAPVQDAPRPQRPGSAGALP